MQSRNGGLAEDTPVELQVGEQSVMLFLTHGGDEVVGDWDVYDLVLSVEDDLRSNLADTAVGTVDGHAFGVGHAIIFLFGPDADQLLDAATAVLRRHAIPEGSFALKEFGPPGSYTERVALT